MPLKAAAFTAVCGLASSASFAQAAEPQGPQIASTSLCGDSYLLVLAPERAAALSWQSRDDVSRATARQRRLPQIWDDPERIIGAAADIVLFGPGEGAAASQFLSKTTTKSQHIKWSEDFNGVKENYTGLSEAIFKTSEPNKHVADLDARLTTLKARAQDRQSVPSVLYLSRAGGTAGPNTYVDAAIQAAGGQNVIAAPGWLTLSPEKILSLSPDMIVTSFMTDGYESINANGVRHKALRHFISARPQVNIPGALWPCAGPGLIEAAERIAAGLDELK